MCHFVTQVEAVSTSVQDSSVLVQRSTLDLILFCFPFHMSQVREKEWVSGWSESKAVGILNVSVWGCSVWHFDNKLNFSLDTSPQKFLVTFSCTTWHSLWRLHLVLCLFLYGTAHANVHFELCVSREHGETPSQTLWSALSSSGHSSWHDSDPVRSTARGFEKRHVPQPQALRLAAGCAIHTHA